jgi:anti-sigma regulatory factor (Ser/Thr protein kinase)
MTLIPRRAAVPEPSRLLPDRGGPAAFRSLPSDPRERGPAMLLDPRRAFRTEVPARPDRAAAVRRAIKAWLDAWRLGGIAEIAALAANELFVNAVEHGSANPDDTVTISVERSEDLLRVEVIDSSPVRPALRAASAVEESGRGLAIVDTLAHSWGTEQPGPGGTGKKVWFTLSLKEER